MLPGARTALSVEVGPEILRHHQPIGHEVELLNLLAPRQLDRVVDRLAPLAFRVLEDGHGRVALLHLGQRVRRRVHPTDKNLFRRAAGLAQRDNGTDMPVLAALVVGGIAGLLNGSLITLGRLLPLIATLGMMVTARGLARYYTHGQPVSMLTDQYPWIGSGVNPVLIFLAMAVIFHIALGYTRYGKYTYAHRGLGDRQRQPVGRHRADHRHRHWHPDPRRDDQRFHLPRRGRLHLGHREGADYHRRRHGRPVSSRRPALGLTKGWVSEGAGAARPS